MKMSLKLIVYIEDRRHKTSSAAIVISDLYEEAFEPIRTNDHPLMCLVDGGTMPTSQAYAAKRKLREDAAQRLAAELAKVIVKQMEANDTHNGYAVNKNG